jgi:hypothetical protein
MQFVFLIIGLLPFSVGKFCSCMPLGEMNDEQYKEYNLILKGKIVKVVEREERTIYLKVVCYYKGKQQKDTIQIISARESGICGIFPSVGEYWLMFAYADGNKYRTSLCTRTKNMNSKAWDYQGEEIKEDLKFLENKRKINGG